MIVTSSRVPTPVTAPTGFRRAVRTSFPIAFVFAVVAAGFVALPWFRLNQPAFSHRYAAPPGIPSGDVVGAPPTPIPAYDVISQFAIPSLDVLAQALPPSAISVVGHDYQLSQPVLITGGAVVNLKGPGSLTLRNGSYIEVTSGASLTIGHLTVRATGSIVNRGFLVDVGGVMKLTHDSFSGLGRIANLARGISFIAPAHGSQLIDSTIADGADGVFASVSNNLRIVGNTIRSTRLDAIVVQGQNRNVDIQVNSIDSSGRDGIVLSGAISSASVIYNTITNSSRYGILLYNTHGAITIQANHVDNAFDGLVLNSVSHTTITNNLLANAARFAIRLSAGSTFNLLSKDTTESCAIGIYAVNGATKNVMTNNVFLTNGENVRFRTSAAGNSIVPIPSNSELKSI